MRRSLGISHVLITAEPASPEWTQGLELAKGLRDHGVRTTLATTGQPTPAQIADANAVSEHQLQISGEGTEGLDWLLFLEKRISPNLVHTFSASHAELAWRCPKVLTLMRSLPEGPVEELRSLLRCQDLVVVPSESAASSLQEKVGLLPNLRSIAPGLNPEAYRWTQNRQMVFASAQQHMLPVLSEVAQELSWPMYVNGANHLPSAPAHIVPVGRIGDSGLAAWYGRSPVFLYCGTEDPFPVNVLEAALCNCALVLPDTPSHREMWDRAALFFDLEDPTTLAAALGQVVEDEDLRHYYRIRARERGANFSAKAMATSYLFAYQETLQIAGLDSPLEEAL